MKYIITLTYKEPIDENRNRARKIDEERKKSGEGFVADNGLIARYASLSEPKVIQIVEMEDPSRLIKYIEAYANVCNLQITPVVNGEEWKKAVAG